MRRTFAAVLLALAIMTVTAPSASADKPVDIIIEDTAQTLDTNTLIPAVENIRFHQPTTVAIYTRAGDYSDNLNEEVLAYARAEHPEWLSPDGQKWADGLYLFALDPVGRQVGTYMGEDRKVSLDARTAIQESTYDHLRDAQWTDGTIAGIAAGAKVINRPWYLSPDLLGTVAGVGAVAVLGTCIRFLARFSNLRKSRRALARGEAAYASVTMDLDATELNANTIPSDSSYGSRVLEKYRTFSRDYARATTLGNEVKAMTAADMESKKGRRRVESYAELAAELDGIDDLISDANTLLNRAPGWERAWDRQSAPFREDLGNIGGALQGQGKTATGQALISFEESAGNRLDGLMADLTEATLSPEDALDGLRVLRTELSSLLAAHARTVIDAYSKNQRETSTMREAMDKSFRNPPRGRSSILEAAYPGSSYYSVASFGQGFSAAKSGVRSSRSTSTSGGSSTGYGSSGRSFTGSGSSSRF